MGGGDELPKRLTPDQASHSARRWNDPQRQRGARICTTALWCDRGRKQDGGRGSGGTPIPALGSITLAGCHPPGRSGWHRSRMRGVAPDILVEATLPYSAGVDPILEAGLALEGR